MRPDSSRNTSPHIVKNAENRRVADPLQRVALFVIKLLATLCNVLRCRSVARCVALKVISTQWFGARRTSATLLLLKINNNTYVHTCACVYRGNIDRHFEMLRPREVASVGLRNRVYGWANLGAVA